MNRIIKGNLVLPEKCFFGELEIEDDFIKDIKIIDNDIKNNENFIVAGFIDIHFHGLGEWGVNDSIEDLKNILEFAPRTGVSSICPTLGSSPRSMAKKFLENIKVIKEQDIAGANLIGGHLEGPFLSAKYKGGMDDNYLFTPTKEYVAELLKFANELKIITLSPEIDGAFEAIKQFANAKVVVSAGHTGATNEQFYKSIDFGVTHVCHLFDTFSPRTVEGGVTQVSLADAVLLDNNVTVELILDSIHVPSPLVELSKRVAGVDRLVGITDSMQGTGLPDGEYPMADGRIFILKNGGVCKLKGNSNEIVGSCLTMEMAFKNLINRFKFSLSDASKLLSKNPAKVIGIDNCRGMLNKNYFADINILNFNDFSLEESIVNGKTRYKNGI